MWQACLDGLLFVGDVGIRIARLRRQRVYRTGRMEGFFGVIRDAMPDYWGRLLIERRSGSAMPEEFDYLMLGPDEPGQPARSRRALPAGARRGQGHFQSRHGDYSRILAPSHASSRGERAGFRAH